MSYIMSWCHIYYITSVILYIYSGYVTASEYYVSADPNGVPCPHTDLPCHNLSYYTADYISYFTDDTIFYFLKGTHILQGPLEIIGVSNITLQGLGHIEQGFHETVMQSTSVIRCSDYNRGGIQFTNSTDVVLKSITITNCGSLYNTTYQQTNVSLLFIDAYNITLEWVSVQNGSGIGLYLYNAFDVLVANSTFAQNQPSKTCSYCSGGNTQIRYGDYYYNYDYIYDQPIGTLYSVDIAHSNFTLGLNSIRCTVKENGGVAYGLGAGLGIYLDAQSYKVQFYFDSVVFYNNIAEAGANFHFYVFVGRYSLIMNNAISTYGKTLKRECSFGGGMILVQRNNVPDNEAEIIIKNSTFSHNIAQQFGGGVLIIWFRGSGNIEFWNCFIYKNSGNIGSGLVIHLSEAVNTRFYFANVVFDSNQVPNKIGKLQGAVILANIHNVTFEQIEVKNHDITGLIAFNSLFTFDGSNIFVNNSGIAGGGIALYDSTRLLIKERSNVSFINNHAGESGGGIFVSRVIALNVPVKCFFEVIPDNSNASFYFINNTADISGDVIYGGNVDYCSKHPDFDRLFHYSQQTGQSVVSSDPIQVCFCEFDRHDCSITNVNKTARPGIDVSISLATVGFRNGLTKGMIKFTDSLSNEYVVYKVLSASCTNVTYKIKTKPSLNTTEVYVTLESSIEPSSDFLLKVIEFNIEFCPVGFPLVNDTCVCRSELNTSSITCDINTQIITRDGDMWIGYNNDSDCLIVYPHCPFDYCNDGTVQFKITSPDPQCLYNRSGILCGQCSEGLSLMLGSNQCGQCTNNYLALIIPFALAGIALVAFVIALNITVSVGTINGLIFYANVVKIYEPIFFPKGPIPFLSLFISWLNLDLGIETCFFDGMDSCSKTWLQFIFPAYVWFLLILIIILLRYSSKVVRLVGRQVIPVLATMILLSYTKLIRTVFKTIYFINIQCNGNNNVTLLRWYIDANVQYVGGYCHLPLFLFSVAVLILLIVPYTLCLLAIPLLEGPLSKYMCCCQKYMKPFFDAYGGPYKDKCRFWSGFLLLVRVVLALVSLDIEATISLDVLIWILIFIASMHFFLRGMYRHIFLFCLELSFIFNLILMAYTNAQTTRTLKRHVSNIVLMSISFLIFCGIIFYHVWDRLLKSRSQQLIVKVREIFKKLSPFSHIDVIEDPPSSPGSPAVACNTTSVSVVSVEMRRETLLFNKSDRHK